MSETNATKVCAQCKHYYTRIDDARLQERIVPRLEKDIQEMDALDAAGEEIRLCYEFHWCNASSPACDDGFVPLTSDEECDMLIKQLSDEDIKSGKDLKIYEDHFCKLLGVSEPQKEIQYVYIGLLQQSSNGELVEIPTEIDGVATNYKRVEMGPLDWYTDDGEIVKNAVDIEFPEPQTDWGTVKYFGLYDSLTGGNLIESNKLDECCVNIKRQNLIRFEIGRLSTPLELLKGGE